MTAASAGTTLMMARGCRQWGAAVLSTAGRDVVGERSRDVERDVERDGGDGVVAVPFSPGCFAAVDAAEPFA